MARTSDEIRTQVGRWVDELELLLLAGEISEQDHERNVSLALDWAQQELQPLAQEAGGSHHAQQGLPGLPPQSEPRRDGEAPRGWSLAWLINRPRAARPQTSPEPAAAL
jgi:hypothetical protein